MPVRLFYHILVVCSIHPFMEGTYQNHSRVAPVIQKKRSFPITGVIKYTQLAQRGPPRAAARYDDDSVRPGCHHQAVAHREESRSTNVLIYLYSS